MFLDPAGSPSDINFRLFGTHVRVSILFWLFSAILGWNLIRLPDGMILLLIWIAACFVSILLHEFGHIWAGKLFGTDGDILLYSFGGLAIGASDLRKRWQRIVVYLAGPAIQLLLFAIINRYYSSLDEGQIDALPKYLRVAIILMEEINWIWPLFNLLPINPLDGGQVARELCQSVWGRKGVQFALMVSIVACAAIALNAALVLNHQKPFIPYMPTSSYTIILFAMLGFENFQLLQIERSRKPWEED
jgi:stage IV sporulation protein FB